MAYLICVRMAVTLSNNENVKNVVISFHCACRVCVNGNRTFLFHRCPFQNVLNDVVGSGNNDFCAHRGFEAWINWWHSTFVVQSDIILCVIARNECRNMQMRSLFVCFSARMAFAVLTDWPVRVDPRPTHKRTLANHRRGASLSIVYCKRSFVLWVDLTFVNTTRVSTLSFSANLFVKNVWSEIFVKFVVVVFQCDAWNLPN